MIYLRQSTASQEIPLGTFVDSTDGDTAQTGLTIAAADITLWKSGATAKAAKNSGGATHMAGGDYYAVLDATDTNTVGPMVLFVHVAGALAVRVECCVLAANVYDWMFGSAAPNTTAPLDAAATRAALGLASANLDTQLTAIDDYLDTEVAAIKAKTDNLPAAPAAVGDIPTAAANAAAVMASTADGTSLTNHQVNLQAFLKGLRSVTNNGNGTYTVAFKKVDGTTTAFSVTYNPTTGAVT